MKKLIRTALIAAFAALTPGCSVFSPTKQAVALNITPKESVVMVNGLAYKAGPSFIEVSPSQDMLIEVWCDKFVTEKIVIPKELSTTGILDACGAIAVLPAIGLFFPGAWKLKENVVNVSLKSDPTAVDEAAEKARLAAEAAKREAAAKAEAAQEEALKKETQKLQEANMTIFQLKDKIVKLNAEVDSTNIELVRARAAIQKAKDEVKAEKQRADRAEDAKFEAEKSAERVLSRLRMLEAAKTSEKLRQPEIPKESVLPDSKTPSVPDETIAPKPARPEQTQNNNELPKDNENEK